MTDATDENSVPALIGAMWDRADIDVNPPGAEDIVIVPPTDCLPPGTVTLECGAKAASCVCTVSPHGDDVPHHCTDENCGGMWLTDPFRIVRLPKLPGTPSSGGPQVGTEVAVGGVPLDGVRVVRDGHTVAVVPR